jgi:hypothetical protein
LATGARGELRIVPRAPRNFVSRFSIFSMRTTMLTILEFPQEQGINRENILGSIGAIFYATNER